MKPSLLSLVTMFVVILADDSIAQEQVARYIIQNGVMSGFSEGSPPVTILLDTLTGKTWMLGVVENSPRWLALPFVPQVPADVLPPTDSN